MIVPVTLIGTVVADPKTETTGRGVPVTKFVMSTSAKTLEGGRPLDVDVTTWSVNAFGQLGTYAANLAAVGQHMVVYGQAYESRWTGKDGAPRRSFEVRADAVAPNALTAVEPARLTLVGTVVGTPQITDDEGTPIADLVVRTARWRPIQGSQQRKPHDVTDWAVVVEGPGADAASAFGEGSDVIVHGTAQGVQRERADGAGTWQDIEVWAEAIGPDLNRHEGRPA